MCNHTFECNVDWLAECHLCSQGGQSKCIAPGRFEILPLDIEDLEPTALSPQHGALGDARAGRKHTGNIAKYLWIGVFATMALAVAISLRYGSSWLDDFIGVLMLTDLACVGVGVIVGAVAHDFIKPNVVVPKPVVVVRWLAVAFGLKNVVVIPALALAAFLLGELSVSLGNWGEIPHWMSKISETPTGFLYSVRTRAIEQPLTLLLLVVVPLVYIALSWCVLMWGVGGWERTGAGWVKHSSFPPPAKP
jgi:hypothetical protein